MTNRYPLIVDTFDSNKIKELPSGDNLNLTGSDIVGVENVTASGVISAGSITTDSVTINGTEIQSVATSSDYNDLINKPTGLSAFTNDANFITTGSNISSLNNDSNFISSVNWPQINNKPTTVAGFGIVDALSVGSNISTLVNDSGYLKASDLQNGVITVDVNNTGDLKGSVFGDDSTPLVDGVLSAINLNNTIRGDVIPVQDSQWDLGSSSQKFADAHFSGTVTANSFVGDGSGLTGITAAGVLQTAGNTGAGSVNLAAETFTVLGTTGQINVEASAFALSLSLAPVVSSDLQGSVFADDSTLLVDGVNASIPASVINGLVPAQYTRFYFDRGGATPSGSVSNSENVGKNFGSWSEITAGAVGGTTPTIGSLLTPTLSGVTVNSNAEFELAAGVYEISCNIHFRIFNTSGNVVNYDFYLYGESGSDWAGSMDESLIIPDTTFINSNDFVVKMGGIYVFENSTQANNKVYLQITTSGSPVNPNLYPDYGFLDIKKIG